jgi:TrmH family RNA methyltransferase
VGLIASPRNARVAAAVRLRTVAGRRAAGRFLVEGPGAVREAIRAGAVVELFRDPRAVGDPSDAADAAAAAGVPVVDVTPRVLERLAATVTPRGPVAVCGHLDVPLERIDPSTGPVIVLVEIRDPGNLGTLIRSADAAGAAGVVVTGASVDLYNEKVVRASAGSLFHVPVARGSEAPEAAAVLREKGCALLAAAADGETSIHDVDVAGPVAVFFGNEAHGLSSRVRALMDGAVRVPMRGGAESLNLAAAAAVILFELGRPADT